MRAVDVIMKKRDGEELSREEIASLIGHAVENEAINATTLEITGGLCYSKGIAK